MFSVLPCTSFFAVCCGLQKHLKRAPFPDRIHRGRRHEDVFIKPCKHLPKNDLLCVGKTLNILGLKSKTGVNEVFR